MWQMHDGMGWWMVFGGIWIVLFWVGVIGLVAWIVSRLTLRGRGGGGISTREDPLEIAKARYARGEITKEEFEQSKRDLSAP